MQNIKTVIIPAAGIGSRLGLDFPKTLLKYNNETLLSLHLNLIKNFDKIIYVVGYKYDLIIDEVLKYNKNVIFVHNKDYLKTNTNYSLCLCKSLIEDDEYFMTFDADLYISEKSFNYFIECTKSNLKNKNCFVGLTNNLSFNPIYVQTKLLNNDIYIVQKFSKYIKSKIEWANICIMKKECLNIYNNYVYENFIQYLPVNGVLLNDCFDIDTKDDILKLKNN